MRKIPTRPQNELRCARQKLVETFVNPLDLAVVNIERLIVQMSCLMAVQPAYQEGLQGGFTTKTFVPSV